jgi:hypothetical protein
MLRQKQRADAAGDLIVVSDPGAVRRLEARRAEALTALRIPELEDVRDQALELRMRADGGDASGRIGS